MSGIDHANELRKRALDAQAALDLNTAYTLLWQAHDMLVQAGDRALLATVTVELGSLCLDRAALSEAQGHMRAAREMYKELDAPLGQAFCANQLGVIASVGRAYATAVAEFEESVLLYDAHGHDWFAASAHLQLAQAHHHAGALKDSLDQGSRALARYRALEDRARVTECLCHLAKVTEQLGDFEESLSLCREALSLLKGTEDYKQVAASHCQLGITLTRAGRTVEAVAHSVTSVNLLMRIKFPDISTNLLWLGRQRSVLPEAEFRSLVQQHATPGLAGTIIIRVDEAQAIAARYQADAQ